MESRKGFVSFLKWMSNRNPGPWQGEPDAAPGSPPPRRVGNGRLRVTFVGHSTVLIQFGDLNLLTDPIWSERGSPVTWAGPKRVRPPGIRFEDLPPIDIVLVSHNHYDHLDVATLRRLEAAHQPLVITGLGNARFLRGKGLKRIEELGWWDRIQVDATLRITFVPAKHFSSRGLFDRNATLWGGFVIQADRKSIYFGGDTGFASHFLRIRRRFGPPTLALLPVGAYKPRWFMAPAHISPREAVKAHRILGARTSMAIHFGTFPLGDDGEHEPLEDLATAINESGLDPDEFWVLGFGEGRELPE